MQEVVYCASLKYVLIALVPGTTQAQLEGLQPDYMQLKRLISGEHVAGIIVTCEGEMM